MKNCMDTGMESKMLKNKEFLEQDNDKADVSLKEVIKSQVMYRINAHLFRIREEMLLISKYEYKDLEDEMNTLFATNV